MQEYINSGILEAYVLGCASEEEVKEVLRMKQAYPEVNEALRELEIDMERVAEHMAITPPANVWNKIEQEINEVSFRQPLEPAIYREPQPRTETPPTPPDYISIESQNTHMRIHKAWKWVFAAVFVLGKIFLGFAIYFYFEARQAKEQVQELRQELRQLKR
jgi:hypothetical protein